MVVFVSILEDAASCRAVHAPREASFMILQDLRRAVALVHIQVDDEHPRLRVDARVQRRDGEVIVNCIAGTVRFVRVVRASPQMAGEAVLQR